MMDGFPKLLTGQRPARGFAQKNPKFDNLASIVHHHIFTKSVFIHSSKKTI